MGNKDLREENKGQFPEILLRFVLGMYAGCTSRLRTRPGSSSNFAQTVYVNMQRVFSQLIYGKKVLQAHLSVSHFAHDNYTFVYLQFILYTY